MKSPQRKEFLTPGEVARLFGVCVRSVARYRRAGKLTAGRTPGGHFRYRADEVYALLRANTDNAPAGEVAG